MISFDSCMLSTVNTSNINDNKGALNLTRTPNKPDVNPTINAKRTEKTNAKTKNSLCLTSFTFLKKSFLIKSHVK